MEKIVGFNSVIIRAMPLVLWVGCASAPVMPVKPASGVNAEAQAGPCWLRAPCQPYDPRSFLTGVGGGQGSVEADDAARADLAKILKVNVHENLELVEKSYSTRGIYGVQSVYSETINREVRSETDLEVEGVEIARRHRAGMNHHSLAVLERGPALKRTDARLAELDAEMGERVSESEGVDAVVALRSLAQATALSRDYAGLNGQRSVIHGGGQGRGPKYSPEDLGHRLEELLKGIGIVVAVTGDESGVLETALADELTSHGFQLVPENAARLAFVGELKINLSPADSYGFQKTSGVLTLTLKDVKKAGNRVYRVFGCSASASSRKEAKALKITVAEIEKCLRAGDEDGGARVLGDEIVSALLGGEEKGAAE